MFGEFEILEFDFDCVFEWSFVLFVVCVVVFEDFGCDDEVEFWLYCVEVVV